MFTEEQRIGFLKAFTKVLKDANGRGPKNIYIKYFEDEIHIVINGVISDFEKYLIKNFGQEAIDVFSDFYQRDAFNAEKTFLAILNHDCCLEFYQLEADFVHDLFIYKMRLKTQI